MFDWLKKKQTPAGLDFSDVDSLARAESLASKGSLARLYLLPPAFGGDAALPNVVYVPVFVVQLKDRIDSNTVAPLMQSGKVSRYSATPSYQGKSFIPNAIGISVSEPGNFEATIRIWGDALKTDQ